MLPALGLPEDGSNNTSEMLVSTRKFTLRFNA
jgi:hypothetical protein